ncbi:MAG: MHS family MFS transporter [Blastocatellia bacterium]|nr:MHS family MFS transporter [Blastocatellia bacterium]
MAAAVGTVIEWYDFYIFGSLAVTISPLFYPPGNDTLALIVYLVTFAVGFVVRPFGALFFGRIGDLVGRKYAFLVTLVLMGSATAAVGFLPTFRTIGYAAPVILILLRIIQGLALGGEYGGAAVYIAEHAPDQKRGFYTSFIQITATAGLFVSLLVILGVQDWLGKEAFSAWGWRLPFLFSIVLVAISLYIRLRMKESPIFQYIKGAGMTSAQPLLEAFTQWENLKRVIVSLFGATAGQGVVWYTGQFYALFYLQTVLKVAPRTANIIVAVALVFGTPFFTVFGALSDRIGRKKIMMAGCLLAVICYIPIYQAMVSAAGNGVVAVTSTKNPVTGEYKLGSAAHAKDPNTGQVIMDLATGKPKLVAASAATDPNVTLLIFLVFVQVIFVCMVYGPIAAYLVEAFPAKVRYTSLSLPYHIGNGVFGGLVPTIGLITSAYTGNIYAGLYYPMIVASITFIVGSIFLKETKHNRIWDELDKKE